MPNATAASGEVGSVEFRSGVAEGTSRFWTEHHSGACLLSRIDPKLDRAADEKTFYRKILFRDVRFSSAPRRHDRVSRRGALVHVTHARAAVTGEKTKNREYR